MGAHSRLVQLTMFVMGATFLSATLAVAQKPGSAPPSQPPSSNMPTPGSNDTNAPPAEPVKPPSKQEKKAYNTFHDMQPTDAAKKTQLGEAFLQQYPQSQYRSEVVGWLATAYMQQGQVDKLEAQGESELQQKPQNPLTIGLLGSNLARAVTGSNPDAQKRLDKAEEFCKHAIEIANGLQKPEGVADDKFNAAKNQALGFAYGGLGTSSFRKGKYADAVTNLQQAVKFSGGTDPVDFYVLGKAEEAQNNFDQALAAYTKCAAINSGMQKACESSIQEVKQHGAQLPK
jgi:tetratricopeptide (TPR) repeat protein